MWLLDNNIPLKVASVLKQLSIACDTTKNRNWTELKIDQEDITDPNLNICAGVRWLFQKRRLASAKLGREATWEEAVAEYKSYLKEYGKNPDHRGMGKFRKYYRKLKK